MTLLETLKALHDKMQDPAHWDMYGICSNVTAFSVRPLMAQWPLYSGVPCYPIQTGEIDCGDEYGHADSVGMWDRENSPYAELRWQLLEFMIETLEKEKTRV